MSASVADVAPSSITVDEEGMNSSSRRGRRPVDIPTVGSVTDRRRVQNRMAQRAYRQRKESAIDVLKQKVSELEKSREDMGQEFLNFTTALLGQDLIKESPEIIEHIKQSTLSLLCSARDDDDDERMDDEGTEQSVPASNLEGRIPAAATPSVEQFGDLDLSMLDGPAQWDYTNTLGPTTSSLPNSNSTPYLQDANSYFQMPANQAQPYLMNQQLPGVPYVSSLPCPKSYAAHEVTFGRRLHRASQQGAFLLASMKHAPPTWYNRTFGFCLHFETRDEIRERLGECVGRSRDSTLNIWTHPFTNVGGAGLFYPPNQDHGTGDLPIGNRFMQHEAYKPSEMSGFSMGPFGPSIQQVRDSHLDAQLRILDPEYAGDWFDCDEVEISLRAYGVTIPPTKDFVTAYIDMAMFEREEDTEPPNLQPNNSNLPSDLGTSDPTSVHCPTGMMGMAMGTMPPPPRSVLAEHWKTPSQRDTKVKVDVERLTTCLVNSMVCLGRTPAVRPKDIRKALKLSLVNED